MQTLHTDCATVNPLAGRDDKLYYGREMMEKMNKNSGGDAISTRVEWNHVHWKLPAVQYLVGQPVW
jgi:hypothetical protein